MPDNQNNAVWLTAREKAIAIERVRENQDVTAEREWKWPDLWESLRDPQTAMFFIIAIGNTMPFTFASQFSGQIVKDFGFSALQTTVISTCSAATIQLGTCLLFSWIAGRVPNTRLWLSFICSVPPLIGFSLLHALATTNTAGRLAGYLLTYTQTMSFTFTSSLMASNYAGHTEKTTASGLVYVGWAVGLIAGPRELLYGLAFVLIAEFFNATEAPDYQNAFEMLSLSARSTIADHQWSALRS